MSNKYHCTKGVIAKDCNKPNENKEFVGQYSYRGELIDTITKKINFLSNIKMFKYITNLNLFLSQMRNFNIKLIPVTMGARNRTLSCENSVELEEIQNISDINQDYRDGAQMSKVVRYIF